MSDEIRFVDVFEPIAITGMGVALVFLARRLYRVGVLRLPPAVALGISGFLAAAWKYPELAFTPDELMLPFQVAEVQFFVSLSICMTLFALDVFIGQARALAKAQERLAVQEAELEKAAVVQQMAAIVESSEDAIIGTSLDGVITTWNRAAQNIFGLEATAAKGRPLSELVDVDERDTFEAWVEQAKSGRRPDVLEIVCTRADGTLFDGVLALAPIKDSHGDVSGVSVIARDVSEKKRAEQLQVMAITDELTGLLNRRGFISVAQEQAAASRKSGKPFSVLFMDLNGLKQINDNLGHQEGDAAIADAASILRATFRDNDVIGRLGGDEFCVLLSEDQRADSETPMSRLRTMIDIHNLQGGRPFKVAMSVGSARFDPKSPRTIEELIEQADDSMYQDKMSGTKRHHLLVCDDDPSVCSLVEVMFTDDYDVTTAYSGKQAIEAAGSQRPDLILMDLNLPDMSGTEVVRELRQDPQTKLTPVIMITGAGDSGTEIESLRAGVDDYVEKPFDEDALRARMDLVLKRSLRR